MLTIKKIVPLSIYHQERMKTKGFVGIGRIQFQSTWKNQESLINAIQSVEEEDINIQIFNSGKIIAPKHLYYAVYFAEQAFALSSNISKNKSIEYLIYASGQRQIKNAIEKVGFLIQNGHDKYAYIVISAPTQEKINNKFSELLSVLNAIAVEDALLPLNQFRIDYLKQHFHLTDFELENSLHCMGLPSETIFLNKDEETKLQAFLQIFTEKMAQLLMENFKTANYHG